MTNIEKVKEWRTIAGQPMDTGKVSELAAKLIKEEALEVLEAIKSGDLKETAKELCDLEYVLLGAELEAGWIFLPLDDNLSAYDQQGSIRGLHYFAHFPIESTGWTRANLYRRRRDVRVLFNHFFPEKDFDQAFAEVHRSNMSKFVDGKCLKRDDGKILKGPDFSPADMDFMVPGLEELKRMPEYLNTEK